MIFDIERVLSGWTETRIKEELDADEVIKKWVMIQNFEWREKQEHIAELTAQGGKDYSYEDVPFPEFDKDRKERIRITDMESFEARRKQILENAPRYDFDSMPLLPKRKAGERVSLKN